MTKKVFLHQLRRGIGSAIIEIKQSHDRDKYKDIVLRCCLKDIGYDVQSEGTKGYYLYTAISALDCKDEFLDCFGKAYMNRLSHRLFQQLTDILKAYVWEGSSKATKILKDKYDQLKKRVKKQKSFPYYFCEREQFEELMVDFINLGKWKSFKQIVEDAGSIILSRNDDQCSYYDWFISSAENRFGVNKVWDYLNKVAIESSEVSAVVSKYQEVEQNRKTHQANQPHITLEFLIEKARQQSSEQRPHGIIGHTMRFSREASREQLINLAKHIEAEDNPAVQVQLLWVFHRVDYPLGIDSLFNMVSSMNDDLQKAGIRALERFKDVKVNSLAVELLESGDTESGLTLLKYNWRKCDESMIRNIVMKSQRVTHSMQMDLRDIYSNHQSSTCEDILFHIYRNGECTYCRSGIVKAMGKNGVLTEGVLLECQYDSYDETRQYAKRLLKRRGMEA